DPRVLADQVVQVVAVDQVDVERQEAGANADQSERRGVARLEEEAVDALKEAGQPRFSGQGGGLSFHGRSPVGCLPPPRGRRGALPSRSLHHLSLPGGSLPAGGFLASRSACICTKFLGSIPLFGFSGSFQT